MALGVGLAGFGLAGRYLHAPIIEAAGMEIRAVVTSRTNEVAETHPQADVIADFDDLLTRDDISLVVLATPNALHHPQARAALDAGKHVVIDKPFTISPQEADDLVALSKDRGLCLSVYHNRRWDSDFLTIRKLMDAGAFGDIASFHMRWDRYRPGVIDRWRERDEPGAGILHDLGAHLFDQATQLVGMPDWVMADVFRQREGALVDDAFEILLGRGRVRMTLGVSLIAADGGWRYRVHGTEGSFLKTGLDIQEDQLRRGDKPTAADYGMEPDEQRGTFVYPDGDTRRLRTERGNWVEFYRLMAEAIAGNGSVPVPAEDAARVVRLIAAARMSSETGKRIMLDPEGRPA